MRPNLFWRGCSPGLPIGAHRGARNGFWRTVVYSATGLGPHLSGERRGGNECAGNTLPRRDVLKTSGAVAVTAPAVFATRVLAQAPAAEPITPLVAAARKEGKLSFYTAMDIPVAERVAKSFEARHAGIGVRVERSGSERIYQRIEQERGSNIFAVDVVNSADAAHFIVWKRNGWLAAYLPEEAAQHFSAEHRDPEGMHITTRIWLSSLGYNTNLVKAEEAPKSYADLLDPKWMGKIIKAHPAYAGSIMTATFQIARDLGWRYFEELAKQKVLQVQSSTDSTQETGPR